ncbi:protein of unknown function (plasmid) [Shinella sp. WSC3-e]|nr:protein of unknown function [Shinella sp. WSC3-e]
MMLLITNPPRSKAEQGGEAMSVSGQRVVEIDAILGEGLEENDSDHEHQIAEATAFLCFGAIAFSHLLVVTVLRVHGGGAPTIILPGLIHGLSPSDKL